MYLLTESETLTSPGRQTSAAADNISAVLSGVSDAGSAIDGRYDTYVETANATPVLDIDLGSAKVIDAIWLKVGNVDSYTVSVSNDNRTFSVLKTAEAVSSDGYSYLNFINSTAYRYWRLGLTRAPGAAKCEVYEVLLMRVLLDLNTDEKRPLHYQNMTSPVAGVTYSTYNQRVVQYQSSQQGIRTLTFGWESLDEESVDALERLWKGPPYAPVLTVYPRPDGERGEIYRAKWGASFGFDFIRGGRRGVQMNPGPPGEGFGALGSGKVVFEVIKGKELPHS